MSTITALQTPKHTSSAGRAMQGLRGTLLLIQWQVRRQAQFLPLMAVVQTALAVSTVLATACSSVTWIRKRRCSSRPARQQSRSS